MSSASPWTGARVQTLTRLWRDGHSASQIARALGGGVTRNAVIGKIHRLGLSGRAKPSQPAARPRRVAAPRSRVRRTASDRAPVVPVSAAVAPPAVGAATVRTIRRGQCRWPIGDPMADGFSLCGAVAVRGAYCAGHAALAYRSPSGRPPRQITC